MAKNIICLYKCQCVESLEPQSQLPILVYVTAFLILDVIPSHAFVVPDCADIIATCPEMLPCEIRLSPVVIPGYPDGTLALDKADHLGNRIFRRNGDQHMHMVCEQMPLLNVTILLKSQLAKYIPENGAKVREYGLLTVFWDKNDMVLALLTSVC